MSYRNMALMGGREVVILPVGSGIARFFALQARSVDAAMLSIPANFMAQDAGFRQLVSFIDQDMVELQGSILTSVQLLESDPKAGGEISSRLGQGIPHLARQSRRDNSGPDPLSQAQRR